MHRISRDQNAMTSYSITICNAVGYSRSSGNRHNNSCYEHHELCRRIQQVLLVSLSLSLSLSRSLAGSLNYSSGPRSLFDTVASTVYHPLSCVHGHCFHSSSDRVVHHSACDANPEIARQHTRVVNSHGTRARSEEGVL